jgi:hypothetical protein
MAHVTNFSSGYAFTNLGAVGRRLLNDFQRHYPLLCKPSSELSYRYVRSGSPAENSLIRNLIADVIARDQEPKQRPSPFKARRPIAA